MDVENLIIVALEEIFLSSFQKVLTTVAVVS